MKSAVLFGLNETPGHRFDSYHPGDELHWVGPIVLEAGSAYDLLELAWEVGNKEGDDGDLYPRTERSVSVGDLIRIVDTGVDHVVASVGFKTIPREAVAVGKE